VPQNKTLQATALMVVPSAALAKQVMDWAALMIPPKQLERTVQLFDPASPETFATPTPPVIVVATADALKETNVAPMRALALRAIAFDEADVLLGAATRRTQFTKAIEKMLTSGFQNASKKRNQKRRKPQIIAVGSTVSPTIMRWLKDHREWVDSSVQVIVQAQEAGDETSKTPIRAPSRLVPEGELPETMSYNTPALARLAHHVLVVAPSGNIRSLSAPAPLERDLEPIPTPDLDADGQPSTRVPSHLLHAFKTVYQASLSGDAAMADRSLLVLRDRAAVEDARDRLAEAGISAQTIPASEGEASAPSLLITDTASCRGLDIADLATVYLTAGALTNAADYIHIAGRLGRLGSVTGGETSGKVVTFVQGDTQEPPAEKAARLEATAVYLRKRRSKRGKARLPSPKEAQEEAAEVAERFPIIFSWEVEKMKVALSTLDARPTDLPLPSIP
jgi:hypothetical protein